MKINNQPKAQVHEAGDSVDTGAAIVTQHELRSRAHRQTLRHYQCRQAPHCGCRRSVHQAR